MTGRRRADRKAPGAALAFALAIALLPTGQAQENTTRGLETADGDPGVHSSWTLSISAAFSVLAPGPYIFYPEICPNLDFFEEIEQSADMSLEEERRHEDFNIQNTFDTVTTGALTANSSFSDFDEDENQLEFVLMVLIPLVLFALLFLSVIILVIRYKRKKAKQETSSRGSQSALQTCELGSENIKVPIFEEDTPSVMEIEMEELDKWMNSMNKNADCECLPTLKEEKESNHNPSDNES
ncbi:transmembrane protein 154 isoform X2 [Mustela nigripes]|uniref:transmembrane protein 154 isoform X2 n=1 Tax=Mustela nigripes TaxID=77151 RepID=UPI00281552AB|nr:transmembrane protein 154 isoform X2 [Mustela nigripes]